MARRFVWCLIIAGGIVSSAVAAGVSGTRHEKKNLPLDGVPDVVLKNRENSMYLPDRIIVKVMPGVSAAPLGTSLGVSSIDAVLASLSVSSVESLFPQRLAEKEIGDVGLARFYFVRYAAPVDAFAAAEQLSALPDVQYAEPWFIYSVRSNPDFIPNDPQFSQQYGLTRMRVHDAWDITQGDTSVVIAIVDSGVETGHPDLAANIWLNHGETGLDGLGRDKRTNGVDDDNNGYIDDWRGWDFGGATYQNIVPDNDPNPVGANTDHGTSVAGVASAVTNNAIGVAGTGFKCRILAIKTAADNDTRDNGLAYIIAGYPGLTYAALMGAKIINCSWGGSGGSQFEQDLINAATQQGALVVAAAGNAGSSAPQYPASYQNVISAASTGSSDVRSSFSSFGMTVDVAAPGEAIRTTIFPSTYTSQFGTSFSSPFTAGVAALVKSHNPGFTPLQVGERVRVTADNINAQNPSFVDQLGKGRVNAFRALTENPPAIRGSNIVIRDSSGGNNNGNIEPNETIDIYITFTNYLASTSNASVTLTTTSPHLTITTNTYTIGSLGTLGTVRNTSAPLRVRISGSVPQGHLATMKLLCSDAGYSDFQWFTILVNPTYQTHNINNVTVTMTNNGRIGFNDFPGNTQGVGFKYPSTGDNHLFEGGIIIGTSSTRLVSNVRNPQGSQDNDFLSRQIYSLTTPGVISNQDGATVYSDSLAPTTNRVGVQVRQFSYEFGDPDHDDYVIVRYDIRNLTSTTISGLYVGQFFDWDIANYATNRTGYDALRSLAYAWDQNTPSAPYIGMRALDSAASVRGLINDASIVLDRPAKWGWISGGTSQSTVGPQDIHNVISSGPYTIAPGQTRMVGFALVGGANLSSMRVNADAARVKWNLLRTLLSVGEDNGSTPAVFALDQNYPNPFNPSAMISFRIPVDGFVTLKVYDVIGREVKTLLQGEMTAGAHVVSFDASSFSSGVYYYKLVAGGSAATRKMLLMR